MSLAYSLDDVTSLVGFTITGVTVDQHSTNTSLLWFKLNDGRELKFILPVNSFIYRPKIYTSGEKVTNDN